MNNRSTRIEEKANGNIYYNIQIAHNDSIPESINGGSTPATYYLTRGQPLLNHPASDYNLVVTKLSIPMDDIPIMIIPIDISQSNINMTLFSVSLQWNAFIFLEKLIWVTSNAYALVPPNIAVSQNIEYAEYYYLYTMKHFCDIINTALIKCYNSLVANGCPITAPPFFRYNTTTKLLSLCIPSSYSVLSIKIFCNNGLNTNFVGSFDQLFFGHATNGQNVQFLYNTITETQLISNNIYTNQLYIIDTQEFNTLNIMTSLVSIVLTSQCLPIRSEWITDQNRKGAYPYLGIPLITPLIQDSSAKIVTDYDFDNSDQNNVRGRLIYNPTAEYRRIALFGTSQISTIDLQFFWTDNYGILHPLYISAHKTLNIKLLFEKIQ